LTSTILIVPDINLFDNFLLHQQTHEESKNEGMKDPTGWRHLTIFEIRKSYPREKTISGLKGERSAQQEKEQGEEDGQNPLFPRSDFHRFFFHFIHREKLCFING
jgi:hypothetical protein